MNAEEFCYRIGLVSLYDYERVEPHFRAAMAEARAQAPREAVEAVSESINASLMARGRSTGPADEVARMAWAHTVDGMIIVQGKLRKLAGGAT